MQNMQKNMHKLRENMPKYAKIKTLYEKYPVHYFAYMQNMQWDFADVW